MKVILGLMLTFGAGLYQASTLIGSGAGAWVCERSDMKGWVKLVDLYEAEKEFQLKLIKLPANLSYQDIVDRVSYRFRKINSDLAEKFEGSMSDVLAGLTFVDSDLQIIDDQLFRIKPSRSECLDGSVHYEQLANYSVFGKVLVNDRLWGELPEMSKAALLVHEAIYLMLRKAVSEENSVSTRRAVGYLFSRENDQTIAKILKDPEWGQMTEKPVPIEFVKIPGGDLDWVNGEKIKIDDFEVQKTELTQSQWVSLLGAIPELEQDQKICNFATTNFREVELCLAYPLVMGTYNFWSNVNNLINIMIL